MDEQLRAEPRSGDDPLGVDPIDEVGEALQHGDQRLPLLAEQIAHVDVSVIKDRNGRTVWWSCPLSNHQPVGGGHNTDPITSDREHKISAQRPIDRCAGAVPRPKAGCDTDRWRSGVK